jgi:phytoene dehydrogenase-like protein
MRVVIVGAGLAGLAAGVELSRAGHEVELYEASDGVGGRVRTDTVDGFRLDRGFQILLDAYPEARAILDYDALDLQQFTSGASIRFDGAFHFLGDPIRDPRSLLATARAPIGSPVDKARILAFRLAVSRGSVDAIWDGIGTTTITRFEQAGFSESMIERFLRPLFAGITLDPELHGSSQVTEFVFRMLAAGNAVVPADGMGAIPEQLASKLPDGAVNLQRPVAGVTNSSITTSDNETIDADHVIVATGSTAAAELAGSPDPGWNGVTSVWFAADRPPIDEPVLVLNGEGVEPINSMAVMSNVSASYAPDGKALIVVSSPSLDADLPRRMRSQLADWFGSATEDWEELRIDRIERAQPKQLPGHDARPPLRTEDGVWLAGDHRRDASINGAIGSGRAVATAIVESIV